MVYFSQGFVSCGLSRYKKIIWRIPEVNNLQILITKIVINLDGGNGLYPVPSNAEQGLSFVCSVHATHPTFPLVMYQQLGQSHRLVTASWRLQSSGPCLVNNSSKAQKEG